MSFEKKISIEKPLTIEQVYLAQEEIENFKKNSNFFFLELENSVTVFFTRQARDEIYLTSSFTWTLSKFFKNTLPNLLRRIFFLEEEVVLRQRLSNEGYIIYQSELLEEGNELKEDEDVRNEKFQMSEWLTFFLLFPNPYFIYVFMFLNFIISLFEKIKVKKSDLDFFSKNNFFGKKVSEFGSYLALLDFLEIFGILLLFGFKINICSFCLVFLKISQIVFIFLKFKFIKKYSERKSNAIERFNWFLNFCSTTSLFQIILILGLSIIKLLLSICKSKFSFDKLFFPLHLSELFNQKAFGNFLKQIQDFCTKNDLVSNFFTDLTKSFNFNNKFFNTLIFLFSISMYIRFNLNKQIDLKHYNIGVDALKNFISRRINNKSFSKEKHNVFFVKTF